MTAAASPATFEPHIGARLRVLGVWDPETDGVGGPASTSDTRARSSVDDATTDAAEADDLELELLRVDVADLPGPFEQFSVRLRGDRARSLDQGTYLVALPGDEARSMFLVPRREDDDHRFYDAMYSVPRPAGSERR